MGNPILLTLAAALFWAAAPLVARVAGISPAMMSVLAGVGTFVAIMPTAFTQNFMSANPKGLLIGLVAGICNGAGVIAFYRLVGGGVAGNWDLAQYLPFAFVLTPVAIAAGAWMFFGESLTMNKFIGLTFACVAIWFLNK